MTARTDAQDDLRALRHKPLHLLQYLDENSGLPGPRANLTLVDAFADVAAEEMILQLAGSPDEFRRLCGTAALGRLYLEKPGGAQLVELMLRAARDDDWRVREGVAMALQRIGDADPALLRRLVADWLGSDSSRVVRAAVAGICEPRLLRSPEMADAALAACERATDHVRAVPLERRRADDVRTLRQALGYCWSVAVAAAPEPGLKKFAELRERAGSDRDVDWIVSENLKKARLQRLLARS
ncbi:HEAT repeat domain-containing protein [Gryllotalpicola ginsengisoli]|uniref:HEAT repeat domain-containing protein n=1 Tax=Gryllotalpicola ginsengisoli TaxID=444608 RepID=UPI0003B5D62F|nr:HEAT repeat domain-containing protein [Gryllotalpicola ginsengisoli]